MFKIVDGVQVALTPEEIEAREAEVKAFKAAESKVRYRKRRMAGYPTIGDQLDVMWKVLAAMPALPDEARQMLAKIEDIKKLYPKP